MRTVNSPWSNPEIDIPRNRGSVFPSLETQLFRRFWEASELGQGGGWSFEADSGSRVLTGVTVFCNIVPCLGGIFDQGQGTDEDVAVCLGLLSSPISSCVMSSGSSSACDIVR
jgi:hypothetical protein